jgi:hypothetical protein
MSLQPVGSCTSSNKATDLGSVLGTSGTGLDSTTKTTLDAGAALTISGPGSTAKLEHFDPNSGSGPYAGVVGGSMPMDGTPTGPLIFNSGTFTISGPGGKDVGAFSTSITLGTPLTWTNQAQITSITRGTPFTLTWTGGDPSQTVLIMGGSSNQKTKESGGFFCMAPISAGSFTIPANVLNDMPATGSTIGTSDTMGMLMIGALPMSSPQKFTAPGLDSGMVFSANISMQAVTVK